MPLYEYECPVCGKRIEVQRKIAEMDEPIRCHGCEDWRDVDLVQEGPLMRRIPTAPSPIFPGASSWRSR